MDVAVAKAKAQYPDALVSYVSASPYDFSISPDYAPATDILKVRVGFDHPGAVSVAVELADDNPAETANLDIFQPKGDLAEAFSQETYSETLKVQRESEAALAEISLTPRDAERLTRPEAMNRLTQIGRDTTPIIPEVKLVNDGVLRARWMVTYRFNPVMQSGRLDIRKPLATFVVDAKSGEIVSRNFEDGEPVNLIVPGWTAVTDPVPERKLTPTSAPASP
jgi:hypothetical protein